MSIEVVTQRNTPTTMEALIEFYHDPATRVRGHRMGGLDKVPEVVCCICGVHPKRVWSFRDYFLCQGHWMELEATKPWSRHDPAAKNVRHYAPGYAFIVPIAMDVARPLGYGIGVLGSMANDLDLIAIPWVEDAVEPIELVEAIVQKSTAFFKTDDDGRYIKVDGQYDTFLDREDYTVQPHGRISWCIQLGNGPRIDIGVMPKRPRTACK